MRVVVTRPEPDGKRTATALRALGHEVLIAPLMNVENVAADLSGHWSAVIITSANAPNAIADNTAKTVLTKLPPFDSLKARDIATVLDQCGRPAPIP